MIENKKTVFFDLGNVILYFSHEKMCQQLALLAHTSHENIEKLLLKSTLADMYERGAVSSEQIYKEFCSQFNTKIDIDIFLHAMSDIFDINEEIISIMMMLKEKGVELIALSNTCPAHIQFAQKKYPIFELFDQCIFSYEVGYRKPEKEIFLHAIAKSSSEIKNCFYTDDIEEYTKTAKELGLQAHTFTTTKRLLHALIEHGFLTHTQVV
jgi:HAD superfamily hydrolase (TIGR01509 family)